MKSKTPRWRAAFQLGRAVGFDDSGTRQVRPTVGRDQRSRAVRKAEARSPGARTLSQVAADSQAVRFDLRGPKRRPAPMSSMHAMGMGTDPSNALGLVVLCPSQRPHQ